MADKSVGELVAAQSVTPTDLFVLEQNGTAKKLTGQILENWLLSFAEGHGGIQSYELLKTEGLVKTYRFTMADQTPIDIDVVDGRGIESVKPTSTNGLVVTYTITYNDGNTDTITVTNGEKGDKGDNSYVWIKYASQKPTASSHSFGDVADNWIGVYSGESATAPMDWQRYTWFEIKGAKGDTGAAATLTSSKVEYQVSDSGSIIPSGAWSESVAVVPQGKYLWTRVVHQFNTGDPVTSYSVSRMGMDGAGSVSSVAGISPDSDGNVPLTADDVKALPTSGGNMTGAINMNGQVVKGLNAPTANDQAANKGYVDNALEEKLSMELLWENASPTSDFAEQEIIVNTSDYRYLLISHTFAQDAPINILVPINHDEYGTHVMLDYDNYWTANDLVQYRSEMRRMIIRPEYIDVLYGILLSHNAQNTDVAKPSISNSSCVPYKIYGIK